MTQLFSNNAATTLAAAITTVGQTSIVLASGKGALFPTVSSPDYFLLTIDDGTYVEIVKVTARASDILTIIRGMESTTARTFASGTAVELRVTAATLYQLQRDRCTTVVSNGTLTPNADTDSIYAVSALAVTGAFAVPSGTPVNGQRLMIRIKDNGTARLLTWNAIYVASGVSLPTTTVAGKTMALGFVYNTDNALNKWQLLGASQEA